VTYLVQITIPINPLLGLVTQGIHYSTRKLVLVTGTTMNSPKVAEVTWIIAWLLEPKRNHWQGILHGWAHVSANGEQVAFVSSAVK